MPPPWQRGGGGGGGYHARGPRPGDWKCPKCGADVWGSKENCFKCGEERGSAPDAASLPKKMPAPPRGSIARVNKLPFAQFCHKLERTSKEGKAQKKIDILLPEQLTASLRGENMFPVSATAAGQS